MPPETGTVPGGDTDGPVPEYLCPPSGPTEGNIALALVPVPGGAAGVREFFSGYRIAGFGTGPDALLEGVRATAGPKFGLDLPGDFERKFGELSVIRCRCRLRDRESGRNYAELQPRKVADILRRRTPGRGRSRQIASFARRELDEWDPPVFASAGALAYLGIPAEPATCRLLDGARRIAAFALRGRLEIEAGLVVGPGEITGAGPGGSPPPVDLLLVTRDRRGYLEKTLANLLADPAPFRLFLWDNGSADGSAELIAGLEDRRVAEKHFSGDDRGQREPFLWFLDRSRSDLAGKIDDDILAPAGWTGRLAPLLRWEPRFGLLGCWTFLPGDWDGELAGPKVIEFGGARVFRNLWIGGAAWLARREHLHRYLSPPGDYGVPLDQYRMTADGLVNGYPLPLLFARHLDDPRDPDYREGAVARSSATSRRKRLRSSREYGEWIAADARRILTEPLDRQLARYRLRRDRSPRGSFLRLLRRLAGRPL